MGEAILFDGIAQGADNVVLTQDIVKSAGAVFSGKDLVAHKVDCRDERGFVSAEFRKYFSRGKSSGKELPFPMVTLSPSEAREATG